MQQRLLRGVYILIAIILAGTFGYMLIEGWSFLDSIFMTITTITTVGFQEVHPLDVRGQIFTMLLVMGGVGGALYALTGIIQYIVEGQLGSTFGRRRMNARIAEQKGHIILCGFGRVGQAIAQTLKQEDVPLVVIDSKHESIMKAEQEGFLYIEGDATSDEVLKAAGVERASRLIAALGTDVDNTYVTLSARGMCPTLIITARASSEEAGPKLKRAGADHIVSPHTIGGRRMAMVTMRPAVVDFIDTVTHTPGRELQLESIEVNSGSSLIGLTVSGLRQRSAASVLAVQKKTDELLPNPPADYIIGDGDRIIVVGSKRDLSAFESVSGRRNH